MGLEQKVDRLVEDVGEIKVTLAEQHVTLKEHIRRTDLLEAQVAPLTQARGAWGMLARAATWVLGAAAGLDATNHLLSILHGRL